MQEDSFIDVILKQFCIDNAVNEKINVEFEFKDIEKYNGYISTPDNIDSPIRIIINKKEIDNYKENNCQVYCTIYHELVHVLDYYNYCKKYFDGNYVLMREDKYFYAFYFWSEFNAKRKSYVYYKNLLQKNVSKESQLEALINIEIPIINKDIDKVINNYKGENLLYSIIHYLGRYMVWEETYSDIINDYLYMNENVKMVLGDYIKTLYEFLKEHKNTLPEFKEFERFNEIITTCNLNITMYLVQKLE